MEKFIKQIELYILLMIFWVLLNGSVDVAILVYGTVFCVAIIKMTYKVFFDLDNDMLRLPAIWRFFWFGYVVFISIIKASVVHLYRIIKNENAYKTLSIEMKTNNSVILTLIANAITLTPGTITLDIVDSTLHIVGFAKDDEDLKKITEEVLSYQKPFIYTRSK